ncbi:hypothetical protein [Sporosarcina cascadiensis]|uniref:hypothetical protein n=1 Tax=Sporosarcina cascadiensis TaxID=2660747 RepID=UPI00129B7F2B|nr:hypothetical protein [Sporosarcina cascadiensis]
MMEPVVLLGLILLLVGIILSFFAFMRREKGVVKVISAAAFFIILFCLVWFEPMTLIYILTWLKTVF